MPYTTGTKVILTLRKYIDGQPTNETKANASNDPDYIASYLDTIDCPIVVPATTTTTTSTTTTTTTTTAAPTTTTTTVMNTYFYLKYCDTGADVYCNGVRQTLSDNTSTWNIGNSFYNTCVSACTYLDVSAPQGSSSGNIDGSTVTRYNSCATCT